MRASEAPPPPPSLPPSPCHANTPPRPAPLAQEIEVIKQVMEAGANEDIDVELQEVLILSEDLQLEEMIGKGAYGEVFKANYEGIHVAIKVSARKRCSHSPFPFD